MVDKVWARMSAFMHDSPCAKLIQTTYRPISLRKGSQQHIKCHSFREGFSVLQNK